MASNDTLFEHQFGFQPKKTSMAILHIYAKIVDSIENNVCSLNVQLLEAGSLLIPTAVDFFFVSWFHVFILLFCA